MLTAGDLDQVSVFSFSGEISIDDIADVLLEEPCTHWVLWDFSEARTPGIRARDLGWSACVARSLPMARHKVALVAPSDPEYCLCRVLEALSMASEGSFRPRVFRDTDEAVRWLHAEDSPSGAF